MTTTILDTMPAPAGEKAVSQISAVLKSIRDAYVTRREQKQAIAHLRSLSDHHLKDIGLSRGEINSAVLGIR